MRTFNAGVTHYFSTNDGVTPLSNLSVTGSGNPMDWSGTQEADSFNANVSTNTTSPCFLTDQKVIRFAKL